MEMGLENYKKLFRRRLPMRWRLNFWDRDRPKPRPDNGDDEEREDGDVVDAKDDGGDAEEERRPPEEEPEKKPKPDENEDNVDELDPDDPGDPEEGEFYSKEAVEEVILALLKETITRDSLLKVIEKWGLRDLIGDKIVDFLIKEINDLDFDDDMFDIDKWIDYLDDSKL
jgi:hypothetical protein